MTVAILADSPTLTSGFGRTTQRIAAALTRFGHRVACYGIKAGPQDVPSNLPYRVWPAEQGGHWTRTLGDFFGEVRPSVLLLNMDAYNAVECVNVCRAAGWAGPTVSYVCLDGLPIARTHLDAQRSCAAVWATSRLGAAYLEGEGLTVSGHLPPGVDLNEFRPLPHRDSLRERIGLGAATVVGVFATNTERKQVARAVAGFAIATRLSPDHDLRLYLHCRPRGHWDLREVAAMHGVADRLIFPGTADFDERHGVPTTSGSAGSGDLSYVDRLNVCDALINVPHSGDVEQVIIEGQGCGVPILHTDDTAIMADTVGTGGVLLPAADVGIGRIGQRLHHVAPSTIGEHLAALVADPARRAELRVAGLANAASYPWRVLEDGALAMVAPFTSLENITVEPTGVV